MGHLSFSSQITSWINKKFRWPIRSLALFFKVTALCQIIALFLGSSRCLIQTDRWHPGKYSASYRHRTQLLMALPGGIKGHGLDAALCSQGEADWNSVPPALPAWRRSSVQYRDLFHTLLPWSDESREQKHSGWQQKSKSSKRSHLPYPPPLTGWRKLLSGSDSLLISYLYLNPLYNTFLDFFWGHS